MFSLTATFPLLHNISTLCSDVRCACGYFLPIQIRPFPHNRNGSTVPLSKAGFLFPENVRKVSCQRSPSGISRSQLWIISEGLTQNSVHGLLQICLDLRILHDVRPRHFLKTKENITIAEFSYRLLNQFLFFLPTCHSIPDFIILL